MATPYEEARWKRLYEEILIWKGYTFSDGSYKYCTVLRTNNMHNALICAQNIEKKMEKKRKEKKLSTAAAHALQFEWNK